MIDLIKSYFSPELKDGDKITIDPMPGPKSNREQRHIWYWSKDWTVENRLYDMIGYFNLEGQMVHLTVFLELPFDAVGLQMTQERKFNLADPDALEFKSTLKSMTERARAYFDHKIFMINFRKTHLRSK